MMLAIPLCCAFGCFCYAVSVLEKNRPSEQDARFFVAFGFAWHMLMAVLIFAQDAIQEYCK